MLLTADQIKRTIINHNYLRGTRGHARRLVTRD
jgi:hypothetical protein